MIVWKSFIDMKHEAGSWLVRDDNGFWRRVVGAISTVDGLEVYVVMPR